MAEDYEKQMKQRHSRLITDLQKEITADELDQLKHVSLLRPGELQNIRQISQLITALERKGKLGVNEYGTLIKMLNDIQLLAPVKMIEEAEQEIKELQRLQQTAALQPQKLYVRDVSQSGLISNKREPTPGSSGPEAKRMKEKAVADSGLPRYTKKENLHSLFVLVNNFTGERQGTAQDKEALISFFKEKMGYELREYEDLSHQQFLEEFTKLQDHLMHNSYNKIIITILSHGDEKGIKTCRDANNSDGQHISIDDIVAYFKSDKLSKCEGIPRIFFIQACRGQDVNRPVESGDDEPRIALDFLPEKFTTPEDADLLIAYATTYGYPSVRNRVEGTWFIQDMVSVFKDYHQAYHLLDLLTMVNAKVAQRTTRRRIEIGGEKQMPCQISTLTKGVYL